MASILPYTFNPQPPPLPKQTGGKRGPSGPINIVSSSSECEDEDSDHSITDFSPPVPDRILSDFTSNSNSKTNYVITVANISSPRSTLAPKKSAGVLPSPRHQINTNGVTTSTSLIGSNFGGSSFHFSTAVTSNNSTLPPAVSTVPSSGGKISLIHHNSLTSNSSNSQLSNGFTSFDNSISNSNSSTTAFKINPSPETPPQSPPNRSCSPTKNFAYEHDHDYENVASPCSSTASGPTYVRKPGFELHAHKIEVSSNNPLKKKKSATLIMLRDGFKKRDATPPKVKPKREPLPMKLRALPQSFWQQPNVPHQVSPAALFPILPPLSLKESEENQIMEDRPITPPQEEKEGTKKPSTGGVGVPERRLTVANTDLLFKLFDGVGEVKKSSTSSKQRVHASRQRKSHPKSSTKGLFLGNDPFLVEDVTDKIFPTLTLEGSRHLAGGGNTSLQLITLPSGDKTVTLPSLQMEQNFPQMLSELVMHF